MTTAWISDWTADPARREAALADLEDLPPRLGRLLGDDKGARLVRQTSFVSLVSHVPALSAALLEGEGDLFVSLRSLVERIDAEPRLKPPEWLLPPEILSSSASLLDPRRRRGLRVTLAILDDLAPRAQTQAVLGRLAKSFRCRQGGAETESPLPAALRAIAQRPDRPDLFFRDFEQSYAFWVASCAPEDRLPPAEVARLLDLIHTRFTDFAAAAVITEIPGLIEDLGDFLLHSSSKALAIDPSGELSWLRMLSDSGLLRAIGRRIDANPELVSSLFELLRSPTDQTDFFLRAIELLEAEDLAPFDRFVRRQGRADFLEEWGKIFDKVGEAPLRDFGRNLERGRLRDLARTFREWGALKREAVPLTWRPTSNVEAPTHATLRPAPGSACFVQAADGDGGLEVLACLARSEEGLPFDQAVFTRAEIAQVFRDFGSDDPWFAFAPRFEGWLQESPSAPLPTLGPQLSAAFRTPEQIERALLWVARASSLPTADFEALLPLLRAPPEISARSEAMAKRLGWPKRVAGADFAGDAWRDFRADWPRRLARWSSGPAAREHWGRFRSLAALRPESQVTLKDVDGRELRLQGASRFEILDALLWELRAEPGDPDILRRAVDGETERLLEAQREEEIVQWLKSSRKRLSAARWLLRLSPRRDFARRLENAEALLATWPEAEARELHALLSTLRDLSPGASLGARRELLGALHGLGFFRIGARLLQAIPALRDPTRALRLANASLETALGEVARTAAKRFDANDERDWALEQMNTDGRAFVGIARPLVELLEAGHSRGVAWLSEGFAKILLPLPSPRQALSEFAALGARIPEAEILRPALEVLDARARHAPSVKLLSQTLSAAGRPRLELWLRSGAARRLLEWSRLVRPRAAKSHTPTSTETALR